MSRQAVIVLVVVLALALLLCCCATLVVGLTIGSDNLPDSWDWPDGLSGLRRVTTRTYHSELRVELPATLIVTNEVGTVTIRSGDVDTVIVDAEAEVKAASSAVADRLLESIRFDASASGDQAEVRVDLPSNLGATSMSVSLTITVPETTSVDVHNNVGEVLVTGVEGSVQVRTDVGEAVVRNVTLTSRSEVSTGVGEVTFSGALPDSGALSLTTGVGEVTVSLPGDSSFVLDASTGVGGIDCEFDLQDRQTDKDRGVGSELRGRAGTDPQFDLTIRAGTGEIGIGKD